jgi:hypothetical protein
VLRSFFIWSRSDTHARTHTRTPQSVGLFWVRDRPVAETSTWQHKHPQETNIHAPVGFESSIPAGARQLTYALDRAATADTNAGSFYDTLNLRKTLQEWQHTANHISSNILKLLFRKHKTQFSTGLPTNLSTIFVASCFATEREHKVSAVSSTVLNVRKLRILIRLWDMVVVGTHSI